MKRAGGAAAGTPRRRPDAVRDYDSGKRVVDTPMIILGVILIVVGALLSIGILYTLGAILAIIGVVLWIFGAIGRPVAGRRYYY